MKSVFNDLKCILKKNGQYIFVKNEKQFFILESTDVIIRNGKELITFRHPQPKPFSLQLGDIVERKLQNGDILLLNRQPTLHKGSMMAFNVIIRPGKTIRTNLAITKSFNADFDGDEMNLHGVNSAETDTELRLLSSVENHIISNQSNKANVVIVQDGLLGSFLLSKYEKEIPKSVFFNILYTISGKWDLSILEQKQKVFQLECPHLSIYCGKVLFSMLLPQNFFYHVGKVIVKQGVLIKGEITKTQLGSSHDSFIALLYNEYSPEICIHFINDVQFMAYAFLNFHGFSIGIKDCIIHSEIVQQIQTSNQKIFMEALLYEESIKNKQIIELYVSGLLGNARDKGMKFAKDHLSKDNAFLTTVTAGSKGDIFNIAQIMGLLGQQNFQGQRIQPSLSGNKRTLPHFTTDLLESNDPKKYKAQGFIQNSFLRGLNPYEFWFHSMTGREGITDTAMKTATSGYIQRRMVKVAEDVQVKYDGTVRNSAGSILQFRYGNHSYDPTQSVIIKDEEKDYMFFTNVRRCVERLNHEFISNHTITSYREKV
jgi:DNA-directed RNA polymerase II subunit RPB1